MEYRQCPLGRWRHQQQRWTRNTHDRRRWRRQHQCRLHRRQCRRLVLRAGDRPGSRLTATAWASLSIGDGGCGCGPWSERSPSPTAAWSRRRTLPGWSRQHAQARHRWARRHADHACDPQRRRHRRELHRPLTLAADISGTGTLSKAGMGTLILTGNNSYAGGTTITGGFINFNSANSFGTGLSRSTAAACSGRPATAPTSRPNWPPSAPAGRPSTPTATTSRSPHRSPGAAASPRPAPAR